MNKYIFLATLIIIITVGIQKQNYVQAQNRVQEQGNIQEQKSPDTQKRFKRIITGEGTKNSPYLHPYSFNHTSSSGIRWDKLGINTGWIGGFSFAFMGVVYAFPVDVSNWYDRSIKLSNWWKHVKTSPAWDKDGWVINGIGHGVLGGYYYSSARSAGLSAWAAFLYTAFISTFAWEYGIEAIMEIPSATDLITTPLVGAVLGEGFYATKRAIVRNNYRVGSSRFFGCFFAFILDPLGELTDYATKEHFIFYNKVVPHNKKKLSASLQITPAGLYLGMKF